MPSVEGAVSWAEGVAADPAYGYSQGADRDGASFDCSSLVCRALRAAGFGTPSPSFSTRTMGGWLASHGWVWHNGTSGVRRGDVLWKSGHTGIAASGSTVVEARIDENGGVIGGRPGDQTGREIAVFALSSMAWVGYWRYDERESEGEMTEQDKRDIAEMVWETADGRWTADRVYRCTSMLKAVCGLGPEDTSDPKDSATSIRAWTMGRWERALRILKGMVGIGQEDTGDEMISTPMHVTLSDEQMARLADMVAERVGK